MSTRKLAKELGLLRQRSQSSTGSKKSLVSNQIFSYLIVIDFESTCWKEKNNYSQEIIEFPAVLLNTSSGEVESEFHTYVQPQEHPTLSEFCTELTGITQMQVEAGIPLRICLSRFCRWLQNLQLEMGVVFPNSQQRCSAPSPSQKLCTFLTWSDWDLGVCLQYECKRKQLHKPDVLNSWIDLRSTYRLFYNRKPKGLNGALQDLGIQFTGREHSGLDDARNTAQLAVRMMRDGCVMKITRSLERTPSVVNPVFGNLTSDKTKGKPNINKEENIRITKSSSTIPSESCQIKSRSAGNAVNLDPKENSVQESVQNLILPKTILNAATAPLWGHSRAMATAVAVTDLSSVLVTTSSPRSSSNKSLVLCSTTLGCLSHLPQPNQVTKTGLIVQLEKDESEEFSVETEERCGSYDDVVLENDNVMNEADGDCGAEYVSDFDSGCYVEDEPQHLHLTKAQVTLKENMSAGMDSETIRLSTTSAKKSMGHLTTISEPYFAVPKTVICGSKTNWHKSGHKISPQIQDKSYGVLKNNKTNTPSPLGHKTFIPGNTSTPNASFTKPKAFIQIRKNTETPRSSFTIYTDSARQAGTPSHSSSFSTLNTPKNVLRSLPANTHSSCINRSSTSVTTKRGQKITSPLCSCGRRAKRQVVSNGGPNHDRGFYCCPVRRSGSGGRIQKGCEFFKWESSLMKSVSPAALASVSLGQINSTFN
ncbi:ERI1 exoribonuclease 2 [Solea senegalensis]|uniref:ERI1 exoribonuclease 2 n=1 Tax=Solea senegalensis TaxID=28829 RepID=A0AAV6Q829_SOLSE|nr:ERI1 exoribonuclease 2 [Solea senegalensis]KAG7486065.1 ERI1 exoribonuclease 2 [Solea senegalensis]